MATDLGELQNKLWEAADQLRANSGLKASEYASPVLGLIFLRYADERFAQAAAVVGPGSDRRPIGPEDYKATGALYLPDKSRFETLLNLPEAADIGKALNGAMGGIEGYNPDLKGVLPKDYSRIPDGILGGLLRLLRALPEVIEGDGFGLIYEYFLGKFAFAEGRKGGEFFTPTSIVRLIVEILEPFHGKIYDPACGTGGMFVQSAHFVERHREDPSQELSIYGQEKTGDTVRLAKMNLAVHGLGGDIREGNTYYEDLHDSVGKFDFVMANPPFNVKKDRQDQTRRRPPVPVRAAEGPTTATTSGSRPSTPRSTGPAGPGSSWPTPHQTPEAVNSQSAAGSSRAAASTSSLLPVRTCSTQSPFQSRCGSSTEARNTPTEPTKCSS